jgi:hypothetical protein
VHTAAYSCIQLHTAAYKAAYPSSVESEAGALRNVSRFVVTFSEHLAQVPWCEDGSLDDAKRWLHSVKKLEQDDFYPDSLVSSLMSVP